MSGIVIFKTESCFWFYALCASCGKAKNSKNVFILDETISNHIKNLNIQNCISIQHLKMQNWSS